MKTVLLIGLGNFGIHVAKEINLLGHEIMAIDIDEDRVNDALPYATSCQIGDCTNEEFIKSLGVNNYDVCIVAIGDNFESSLETTYLLKEHGAKKIVARASKDSQAKFLKRNGAEGIIYPEKQLAKWTAIHYCSNHLLDYIGLDEEYSLYEVETPLEWIDKTIGQINVRKNYGFNILAIKQNGVKNYVITPDTKFSATDSILVLAKYEDMKKCFHI
ncbi:MAG: TrkA family potassium uptake protein [Erysipelotrichaceae bacterium]|nr:TrkA family potassium uptake protein [Erysipelotrichaceae bacterium]